MKLYMHPMSGCSNRVMSFLDHHPEIEIERVHVALEKGEHKGPEYRAKNPMGRVPLLELDDGSYLFESAAILKYLMARYARQDLLAEGTLEERARLDQWATWGLVHLGFVLSRLNAETGLKKMMGQEPDPAKVEACTADVIAHLEIINELLNASEGDYLCAEHPTLADYMIAPNIKASSRLAGLEVPFEAVQTWVSKF